MFYESNDGKFINLQNVAFYQKSRDQAYRTPAGYLKVTFNFGNGDAVEAEVDEEDFKFERLQAGQIIPAESGFWRLQWFGGNGVRRSPIIGWKRDQFGGASPVCLEEMHTPKGSAIQYPDGRVIDIGMEEDFNSDADWVRERERYASHTSKMLAAAQAAMAERTAATCSQ